MSTNKGGCVKVLGLPNHHRNIQDTSIKTYSLLKFHDIATNARVVLSPAPENLWCHCSQVLLGQPSRPHSENGGCGSESQETPWKCVFHTSLLLASVRRHGHKTKFHLECKLRFPCAQLMLRQMQLDKFISKSCRRAMKTALNPHFVQ